MNISIDFNINFTVNYGGLEKGRKMTLIE